MSDCVGNLPDLLAAEEEKRIAAEAERDRLREALKRTTWDLATYTFRGKDISLGEEAERLYREALGLGSEDAVLGHCPHGVDLDRAFCPHGCRR